jgi:hypothetical protein
MMSSPSWADETAFRNLSHTPARRQRTKRSLSPLISDFTFNNRRSTDYLDAVMGLPPAGVAWRCGCLPAEAVKKLRWYDVRWKVELFHKILKSGCRAEDARLRTAERLVNLLSLQCILSWRIFWMTMLNRVVPDGSPRLALTALEIDLLDALVPDKAPRSRRRKTLSHYLTKIARIGGYLARGPDPPPGNTVMGRGLTRLMDIELGALIGARIYG